MLRGVGDTCRPDTSGERLSRPEPGSNSPPILCTERLPALRRQVDGSHTERISLARSFSAVASRSTLCFAANASQCAATSSYSDTGRGKETERTTTTSLPVSKHHAIIASNATRGW